MRPTVAASRQLLADTDTPVSAFAKLCGQEPYSFLLESSEGLESVGRYSIVAWEPLAVLRLGGGRAVLSWPGGRLGRDQSEFFALARRAQEALACADPPELPFVGSLAGYVGYDAVRLLERLPAPSDAHRPAACLAFPSRFAVFDHLSRRLTLVALAPERAEARAKLADIQDRLRGRTPPLPAGGGFAVEPPPREPFLRAVARAQEYILDGDLFQVVLSGRFAGPCRVHPLAVYRHLRVQSPSPYMFYLNLDGEQLVGASPETLVKVASGGVVLRPIAGTRGRAAEPARDRELERELLASDKERAEHLMLVDLARNDAGRVSRAGSVGVEPFMGVERFSHVMHLVSQVEGRLPGDSDVWEVFRACFPAGTVSGAPKVRAMEIIDELESGPRGAYAGGVGRFGPGQSMDTCIAIRMLHFAGGRCVQQVGAGVVADSVPEQEYQEILHKGAQGMAALAAAGGAEP